MKMKLPVGKYQMLGSTIKQISTLIGTGSTISLPVVGAPQNFILECDINPCAFRNEYPELIDDERMYWVSYSNCPEVWGSELYATVSIGNPDYVLSPLDDGEEYFKQYYGLTDQ